MNSISIPTPRVPDYATGSTNCPEGRHGHAAAFDTRVHASTLVTGQASKGIAKRLHRHGFDTIVEPESFFVDKHNHLEPDEAERATAWGRTLATKVTTA